MKLILLLTYIQICLSIKIIQLNDIHLDPTYNFTCQLLNCQDIGIFGRDSPITLVNEILQDVKQNENESIDLILLIGDLVAHGISSDSGQNNWDLIKQIINNATQAITQVFPDKIILGSIGNNDVIYHYQAPNSTDKGYYYQDLYDIWFTNVSANSQIQNLSSIKETFLKGGFFRYNLTDNLSFISINTILVNIQNKYDLETAEYMLEWLELQLSQASEDQKFILFGHIFPGLNFYITISQFWNQTLIDKYLNITQTYESKLIMFNGAHIHSGDIKAPKPSQNSTMKLPLVVIPSISPVYKNNPGYGILTMDGQQITYQGWRYLDLYKYQITQQKIYKEIDVQNYFNIDLNDGTTIQEFVESLQADVSKFGNYVLKKMGVISWLISNIFSLAFPIEGVFEDMNYHVSYACSMKYYQLDDYYDCIGTTNQ